jgi:23S rRNA (guanosine2251-2'-O)-methyltransferase
MPQFLGGQKPVLEALISGFPVYHLYLASENKPGSFRLIADAAGERSIPVEYRERRTLDRLTLEHQGVVAEIGPLRYADLDTTLDLVHSKDHPSLLLLLDGIQDPQNLGALVRTAEVAGVDTVILPEHQAAGLTPAVIRASAGAFFYLPVVRVGNLVKAIDRLKSLNIWVIGLEADAATRYDEVDYRSATAIVVGSEGQGLGRLVRKHCDDIVNLPMAGHINSLNASVAGGIVLFEALRQRYQTTRHAS